MNNRDFKAKYDFAVAFPLESGEIEIDFFYSMASRNGDVRVYHSHSDNFIGQSTVISLSNETPLVRFFAKKGSLKMLRDYQGSLARTPEAIRAWKISQATEIDMDILIILPSGELVVATFSEFKDTLIELEETLNCFSCERDFFLSEEGQDRDEGYFCGNCIGARDYE